MDTGEVREFDIQALFDALDLQRRERGLSWQGVADELWGLSAVLNERRRDHPISPGTITGLPKRRATSCQHALFMLRWLGRTPESFLRPDAPLAYDTALPAAGPDRRLRWSLGRLHESLDAERRERGLS